MRNVVTVLALVLAAACAPASADVAPPPLEPAPDPSTDYYVHAIPEEGLFSSQIQGYEAIVKSEDGHAYVAVPEGSTVQECGALDLEKAFEVWKRNGQFYGYVGPMTMLSPTPVKVEGALAVPDLYPGDALEPVKPKEIASVEVPEEVLEEAKLKGPLTVDILDVETREYAYVCYTGGPLVALLPKDGKAILPYAIVKLVLYDPKTGEAAVVNADEAPITVSIAGGRVKIDLEDEPVGSADVQSLVITTQGLKDTPIVVANVLYGPGVCVGRAEKIVEGDENNGGGGNLIHVSPLLPVPPLRRRRSGGSP